MRVIPALLCAAVLLPASGDGPGGITTESHSDRVSVLLDGKPLTALHFSSKWDKPFLYPIRTVSGLVISRGWPVEPRPGESDDHPWHRGIWFGHGDINGEDFWREKKDGSTSRLLVSGEPRVSADAVEISLAMVTPKGARLGTVAERFRFRRQGNLILIDSAVSVHAGRGVPLRFGDTEDGGFGFRLADEFRQDRGAELMNSERRTGTENIWGRSAKWVKYSASIGGKRAGVAVLDHPSNLRHPTRWHARGYGLCAANPFSLKSFTNNKTADGSHTAPAGRSLELRYLIVIHEGELSPDAVDKLFASYKEQNR
jgi:hypothetical protein